MRRLRAWRPALSRFRRMSRGVWDVGTSAESTPIASKVQLMSEAVLVLSTAPDDESTDALARTLVEERLAACVNVLPAMTSIYRWQGTVERSSERQLIIKTTRSRLSALCRRFVELHSYAVPEFIVMDIPSGSSDYLDWIAAQVIDAHQ